MKRRHLLSSGLLAVLLGMAGAARASDNIYWSVGVVQPGISVGISNAPGYPAYPAYPAYPGYGVVMPRPVYVAPPVPVYYGPPPGWGHGRHKHGRRHGHRHD